MHLYFLYQCVSCIIWSDLYRCLQKLHLHLNMFMQRRLNAKLYTLINCIRAQLKFNEDEKDKCLKSWRSLSFCVIWLAGLDIFLRVFSLFYCIWAEPLVLSLFGVFFCLGDLFFVLQHGLYYILLIKLSVVVFTVDIDCSYWKCWAGHIKLETLCWSALFRVNLCGISKFLGT